MAASEWRSRCAWIAAWRCGLARPPGAAAAGHTCFTVKGTRIHTRGLLPGWPTPTASHTSPPATHRHHHPPSPPPARSGRVTFPSRSPDQRHGLSVAAHPPSLPTTATTPPTTPFTQHDPRRDVVGLPARAGSPSASTWPMCPRIRAPDLAPPAPSSPSQPSIVIILPRSPFPPLCPCLCRLVPCPMPSCPVSHARP